MTLSVFLQLLGVGLELVGVGTVAWGSRRSVAGSDAWESPAVRSVVAKLTSRFRKSQTVAAKAHVVLPAFGSVSARGRVWLQEWDDDVSVEHRLLDVRRIAEGHSRELDELYRALDAEERARLEADEAHRRELVDQRAALERLVEEITTGGLRLEAWGVAFFVVGVVAQAAGNLMG